MLKPKETGEFFNLIRSHAIKNELFYLVVSVIAITIQTGLIFSTEMIEIYTKQETNLKKLNNSIMSPSSIFRALISMVDISVNARKLDTSTYIGILFLIIVLSGTIVFSFLNFKILKKYLKI